MSHVTPDERARIVALLRAGGTSAGKIGREVGRHKSTVSRIAAEEGIDLQRCATKKATAAKRDYAKAERLLLLNEGFDKARDLLARCEEARDLQAWSVAVGTLVDKRRLEDGEATSREEKVDPERRRQLKAAFDELAARRKAAPG